MIEIRALSENDAEIFWNLRLRALRDNPEAFSASYKEEKEIPIDNIKSRLGNVHNTPDENFVLGAFNNEKLIGMVGFYREKRTKLRHRGTIWGMYIVPEQRRRGIGKKLLLELINRIKLLPCLEQVYLSVVTTNKAARNLYLSIGFKPYGFDRNALKLGDKYLDEENMVYILPKEGPDLQTEA